MNMFPSEGHDDKPNLVKVRMVLQQVIRRLHSSAHG